MLVAPGGRPGGSGRRGAARLLVALAALVLLAGCRVDVSVRVEADAGGAGWVRATVDLDEEAAAVIEDLAGQLRVDDLTAAGWVVEGPTAMTGGGTRLRASKRFVTPEGANRALRELGGPSGPLASLRLTVDRGSWTTESSLRGRVDLSGGLAAFGDEALAGLLGNPTLGLDPAELERELGRPLDEVFTFELAADLPGRVDANAPSTGAGGPVWPARFGTSIPVRATARAWNWVNLGLGGVAVLSGLALLGRYVRRSRRISWG
ncbi:MAG: hypothetical protein ACRD0N_05085 [Acidimicrobiales bacterium]